MFKFAKIQFKSLIRVILAMAITLFIGRVLGFYAGIYPTISSNIWAVLLWFVLLYLTMYMLDKALVKT